MIPMRPLMNKLPWFCNPHTKIRWTRGLERYAWFPVKRNKQFINHSHSRLCSGIWQVWVPRWPSSPYHPPGQSIKASVLTHMSIESPIVLDGTIIPPPILKRLDWIFKAGYRNSKLKVFFLVYIWSKPPFSWLDIIYNLDSFYLAYTKISITC